MNSKQRKRLTDEHLKNSLQLRLSRQETPVNILFEDITLFEIFVCISLLFRTQYRETYSAFKQIAGFEIWPSMSEGN
jgi:hypothetical protein